MTVSPTPQQPAAQIPEQELEQAVGQALQLALNHHQSGRLQDAEKLYRGILEIMPAQPGANYNLGLLEVQAQRPAAGLPYFEAALQARPEQEQYWLSYIDALIQSGQAELARQVLELGRQHGLQGEAAEDLAGRLEARPPAILGAAQPRVAEPISPPSPPGDKEHAQSKAVKSGKSAKALHKDRGKAPSAEEMNAIVALHGQGRTAEAETLARSLSLRFPLHGFGWKVLGNVLHLQGRVDKSLPCMQKAARLLPGDAMVHNNLGITLKDRGRLDEAEASLRRALALKPEYAEAHNNLGITLKHRGRLAEAEASLRRALALKPDYVEAHNNLGIILQDQGRLTEAEASLRRAMSLKPDLEEAHYNLGNTLKDQGRLAEAEASLRRALALKPDYVEAHNNLGITFKDQGRLADAEASLARALALKPDYAEAHSNLGSVLKNQGRFADAEASLRRALALKPDYAEAHNNLGETLKDQGRLVEAQASLRQALVLDPNYAEAHYNLSIILKDQGRLADAEASLRRALVLKPDFADAHNNLGNLLQDQGRLTEAIESYQRTLEIQADYIGGHSNLLFCLSHAGEIGAEALFAEHCRFGKQFEAPLRSLWPQHGNLRDPERCLQIGFVSADLRNHSVATFIEPVLAHLSGHEKLSLHAYYNHTVQDSVTQRLRGHLTHWHCVAGLSDAAMAEKIRADGIDILIDLSGHTAHNRLPVFARKPAPVQASWMGYPGTTGLKAMDYYLTDRFHLPPGQFDRQFTEKLAYLPANVPFLPSPDAPPVNVLPALANGHVTFGSFNRPSKLSLSVIALWSQLLRALPHARMVLGAMPEDGNNDTLIGWFAREGIARERLSFHSRSGMPAYLALHHHVDVCLDTFPYGGGTTTLHALWMGVPTLTLAGHTVAGRTGACLLEHVGLDEFIAQDAADFVQKALSVASDMTALAKLRATLRERFEQSSLGRPGFIADGLERALRTMWQRWCAGLPAASFEAPLPAMTVSPGPQQPAVPLPEQLELAAEQALQLALNHHQSGRIQDAEKLYRGILEIMPAQPGANYNLGLLEVQAQRPAAGLPYFEAALQARPEQEQYWLSYIDALIQSGQAELARQVLELGRQHGLQGEAAEDLAGRLEARPPAILGAAQPGVAEPISPPSPPGDKEHAQSKAVKSGKSAKALHKDRGKAPSAGEMNAIVALYGQGRTAEAEALARSLTLRFPLHGFGWKVLGNVLHIQGRAEEALPCMQKAATLLPEDAAGHNNLGIALQGRGRLDESEASLRRALALEPEYVEAHNNLGITLKNQRRFAEAEASLRRALALKPDYAEAHSNLGINMNDQGRLTEAEASVRRAMSLKPDLDGVHYNLGNILKSQGRLVEAEASLRRALALKPDYVEAHNNLGITLKDQGRLAEAEASLRQALALKPDYAGGHSNLLFCLTHAGEAGAEALFAEHCRFGEQFEAPLRPLWPQHGNLRDPERCLRVGFVSADLRDHAVATFIEPVLAHLSGHEKLSLHAYYNHTIQDSVTQRLRGHLTHWHCVAGLSDAAMAEKIRADGIDILIDLSGHTAHNRLPVFARKPAPVQASWMGYPGTTGLKAMDYYLTDRFHLPPGQFDRQFTEKLAYLPANAPFLPSPDAPPVNVLPALANGHVTFGSFNRPSKLSLSVIALWSQLLRALPHARMVLGAMPEDGNNDTLIGWFAREGIARERLSFHPRSGMPAYLALHHHVDVCLDTFPYGGGTTTLHALWMGVPTLTLAGHTVAGRTGACLLEHVGLDEFIAQDAADFVQKALSVAGDIASLSKLRATLRERFEQSSLGRPGFIADGLERALRTMWQRWCAGLPAASFEAPLPAMTVSPGPQQPAVPLPEQLELAAEQALQLALNHHQSGRIQDAEKLYRGILEIMPAQPGANYNLGLLEVQAQRPAAGLPYFEAALQARPEQEQYWLSYIDALIQSGQAELARQVLELGRQHGLQGEAAEDLAGRLEARPPAILGAAQPRVAEPISPPPPPGDKKHAQSKAIKSGKSAKALHKDRGKAPSAGEMNAIVALHGQGRTAEAEALARSLTLRFPLHGFGWKVLGTVLHLQGRAEEALPCMQKAATLLPGDAMGHNNLGITLQGRGRLAEAEASLRRALALKPDFAEAHNNLGIILKDQGRLAEAEASLRRALALKADYVEAHNNLGIILQDLGRLTEAEASLRRAMSLKPDLEEAHYNLGNTLKDQGRLAEAETSLRRALALKPDYAEAHNNLGITLKNLGRLTEAEASLRQALALKPDYADVHNNLGTTLKDQGRLAEAAASLRQALAFKPDYAGAHSNLLFCLTHTEGIGAEALFAEHCRFGKQFEAPLRPLWPQHCNPRDPERCLRVGFVSADLRNHAVATFIEPVLAHLASHEKLSLHAYYNHTVQDSVTQRLRGHLTHWHCVAGLSDADMAEKIRADGIDILIDLSGHTAHNRLQLFARKPAPVQVSWIGYPGTTGLQAMDYYLTDRFHLPPGQFDRQFTEKLAYLPANVPFLPSPDAPPVNVLPALANGHVTFGSFNRPSKLSLSVIALWSQLLRALPNARMVLGAMPEDGNNDTLIDWFAREGIARERLSFHSRSGMPAYLALHHHVDVCLDTFPYAGGTTTLHALWMGVPTLTLAGHTVAGRTGACILEHVGLEEFAAQDVADFVQKGLSVAGDMTALAKLRATLRERFEQSSLGRPEVIADGLEHTLRTMWQRWCAGLPAASFEASLQSVTAFPTPQQPAAQIPEQELEQAVGQALQLALNHHQSGRLEDAEKLYRGILEIMPAQPGANYNLGLLEVQAQRPAAGLPYFEAALQARPEQEQYWLSYIDALIQSGQAELARQVLELGRQHGLQGEAAEDLAGRLEASQPVQGAAQPRVAEPISPPSPPGDKEHAQSKAVKSGKPAKALHKDHGKAPSAEEMNAIVALHDQGRTTEVETLARALSMRFPLHGFGWKVLGTVLHLQGRVEEAFLCMQKAARLLPGDAVGHNNLGITLKDRGRLAESEASLRRALALEPEYAEAHFNLSETLKIQGRLAESEASLRRALALKPDYVEAHNNLGIILQDLGRITEAIESYQRTLEIQVNYPRGHSNLLFCLSHLEGIGAETLFAEHCRFGEQFEAPLRSLWQEHGNPRDPGRCLQIGFVSGDLRDHAVAYFIEPVLAHLAGHEKLSLHAYYNHTVQDSVTQRLRGHLTHWHCVAGLSDADMAEKIRADGIDILIDLSGHTAHNRLLVFARKPAPVQASWIGYPGTTGLRAMDYLLVDRFVLPPGQLDGQFTEKIGSLLASAPFLPDGNAPPLIPLPALSKGYVTFGSFNRPSKLSASVIGLWSQLLRAIPDSRMLLGAMPEDGKYDTLSEWFASEGIAPERLSFHPRCGMDGYLNLHQQVDICLDTFPYTGGTTTFHALWMGVPTLTLTGNTVPGRITAAVLAHVGLNTFVAHNAMEFVQKGLSAAGNLSSLASLRAEMRERIGQSAMGQPAMVAAGMERALRIMWQRWCAGLPAQAFEVRTQDLDNLMQETDK